LEALGMSNQRLALNGVFTSEDRSDELALALEVRGRRTIQTMPSGLASLPRIEVPLLRFPLNGIENLAVLSREDPQNEVRAVTAIARLPFALPPLSGLINEIERGGRGVVMTMGKGGVGKTTIAAAIAVELARRGHPVRLSTTDPAAHVTAAIGTTVSGLEVGRIDPVAETRKYTMEVQAKAAPHLDAKGQALLEEDLRSPCTEEIAVFRAFAETVAHGDEGFVVLDTAPTGHTLLLLDAAEAYHREILRTTSAMPEAVRNLLPRLRDPDFTRVLLVTLPEATPVHEAARLQDDLLRAGISPFGWIINQGLWGIAFRDPLLIERGMREEAFIAEVRNRFARRLAYIPWQPELPVGVRALRAIIEASVCSPPLTETVPATVTAGTFGSEE
jgi:arsenite/tail-anchored protein-transporting ATPase